jgi:cysteine desulfurase
LASPHAKKLEIEPWFRVNSVRLMLYFDHNATTPLSARAKAAWLDAVERFPGNPSSPHRIGARADAALTDARERLARILGCSPLDIVWTSGASESGNTVLHHFARKLTAAQPVWVSAVEHPCVLESARHYFGARLRLIPVTRGGVVDLDWLASELQRERPGLVAIMAANNETGVIQPWREALVMCREHRVPFFCDAVQWIGKLPATGLGGCDFASGSAHKFGGPKGVGFLKCGADELIEPLIRGGPQEDRRRAGTENVAGVLATMAALEERESALAAGEQGPREAWRDDFEREMISCLPGAKVVGAGQQRLWNTVSALMPDTDGCQRWVVKLDKAGYAVSTGSACSSGKESPSHVLSAMDYSTLESGRVLRFSSGWETTPGQWNELLDALVKVYAELSQPADRVQPAA